jgi:hypothetical protein
VSDLAIVGNRIDAVTLAYRVELEPEFVAFLGERAKLARAHGRASFAFGPVVGELRYSRAEKCWLVVNALFRIRIDVWGPGRVEHEDGSAEPGWTLEVIWSAEALARTDIDTVVRTTRKIAGSCGVGGKVWESRLRRIDWCADVAGWQVEAYDASRLVRRSRAKLKEHDREHTAARGEADDRDAEVNAGATVHDSRRRITGVTVCPGGEVLARLYDKPEELKAQPVEKRDAEEGRWRARGWDGVAPVTRVEFQIRGAALKELGLRDPDRPYDPKSGQIFAGLGDVVDRVWLWCLTWVKLCKNDNVRPSRRSLDPVWMLLHGVKFVRDVAPGALHGRVRLRGGATHEQTLGCVLSVLAAAGRLERRDERGAELLEDGADAADVLAADVRRLFLAAGDAVTAHLVEKWTPPGALEQVAVAVA